MKKRRIAIIAFLLCACLCIGAGYAALSDNLFIKGEATLSTTGSQNIFDDDIYFTAAAVTSTDGTSGVTDTAVVGATDNDSVTFYVKSLAVAGQKVVYTFTIHNAGACGYDASIALDAGQPTNTNADFFDIEFGTPNGTTVAKGGDLEVTVTVTLKQNPTDNTTAAFTVNLTATSISA